MFLPLGTDDTSHDEVLSSRIAAVNLLDLGLQHLGVEVGMAGRQVEALVKACGQSACPNSDVQFSRADLFLYVSALTHLDSVCRSPGDKAATLVSVHKILVGKHRSWTMTWAVILILLRGSVKTAPAETEGGRRNSG